VIRLGLSLIWWGFRVESGIFGCVMVEDGKTFGRFLMIFCVLGGKIGKVVLTLIFDYFLKFGGCGVEGLASLFEEEKLDVCLFA
jgi:hypothetical protein